MRANRSVAVLAVAALLLHPSTVLTQALLPAPSNSYGALATNGFASTNHRAKSSFIVKELLARAEALPMEEAPDSRPKLRPQASFQASCDSSTGSGRADATQRHGSAGWFGGGLGGGVLLGLIGAGVLVAAAANTNPQPDSVPSAVDEDCYREGYRSRAKNKNMMATLGGGLLGTAAFVVVWLAVLSDKS
jgi:hypothetical protein